MQQYIFVLGRDPELSALELFLYLQARKVNNRIIAKSESVIIIESDQINSNNAINDLGGIAKIGEVIKDLDSYNLYTGKSNKIKYAISNYSGEEIEGLREYLKKRFKEEKLKAVYKKSQRNLPFLTPSEVIKNNLLKEGVEIIIYKGYAARTIAIFNPKEYIKRDLQRPKQNPLLSISLRLAKILINLSGAKPGKVLLDPFCGVGTIVQEAALMDIDSLGLELNISSFEAAQENLSWLKSKYSPKANYKIMRGDATRLSSFIKSKVDCIATEPYLGPLLKKKPTIEEAVKEMKSLEAVYRPFLEEAAKVLKQDGKIALVVPRFRTWNNKVVRMNFLEIIKNAGLIPAQTPDDITMPIPYKAPKGKIERDIWVLVHS